MVPFLFKAMRQANFLALFGKRPEKIFAKRFKPYDTISKRGMDLKALFRHFPLVFSFLFIITGDQGIFVKKV